MSDIDTPGTGLYMLAASNDQRDKYFESDDLLPVHTNIYIPSDPNGVATASGKVVDIADELVIIFDRTEAGDYPFDEIVLSFQSHPSAGNYVKVWSISSTCARMLEMATAGKIRHSIILPQVVIKLPMWMVSDYCREVPGPTKFDSCRTGTFTYGNSISVEVIGSSTPFTLGVHATMISNKQQRKALCSTNRKIPIDRWDENHTVYGAPSVEVLDVEIIIPEPEPTTKVRFLNHSNGVATDFMFGAFDINGEPIPIKYLRGFHGSGIELFSVNTSQLQLKSGNNTPNSYLYSHLPGKINIGRLGDVYWEVEFFTPQTYASIYVYPRIWNQLMFIDKTVGLRFN